MIEVIISVFKIEVAAWDRFCWEYRHFTYQNLITAIFVSEYHSRDVAYNVLRGFGSGDVVHQSEKHCNPDTLFHFVRVTDTGDNKYSNFEATADIDAIAASGKTV